MSIMGKFFPDPTFDSPVGWFAHLNDLTNSLYVPSLIFLVWVSAFFALKNNENDSAFTAASFFALIVSILFSVMGLLNAQFTLIPMGMLIIGFIIVDSK